MSRVIFVDDISILRENTYPRVINYTAKWCGPCKNISPRIDELSLLYPNIYFFKVDINEQEDYCEDISSVPLFLFYHDKKATPLVVKGAKLEEIQSILKYL